MFTWGRIVFLAQLQGRRSFIDVFRYTTSILLQLQLLWGKCLAGALYIEDFKRLARSVGFTVPRALNAERITITDAELAKEVARQAGDVTFCSITYRLFKLPGLLESLGEDYGQVATYKVRKHSLQHYMEPISSCHRRANKQMSPPITICSSKFTFIGIHIVLPA